MMQCQEKPSRWEDFRIDSLINFIEPESVTCFSLFLTYLIKEYPQQGVWKHWIKFFYRMIFCFAYSFYGEKIVIYADR